MGKKGMAVVPASEQLRLTPEWKKWLEKRDNIFSQLNRQLLHGLQHPGGGLTLAQLQMVCEHINPFFIDVPKMICEWRIFYRREFGLEIGEVKVPPYQSGFERLIVIPRGLELGYMYARCKNYFPCNAIAPFPGLQEKIIREDPYPEVPVYAVWIRGLSDADHDWHAGKSVVNLKEEGVPGITLLERMVFELKFFQETGRHLDVDHGGTLCSGSQSTTGYVWVAGWLDNKFTLCDTPIQVQNNVYTTREVVFE